MPVILLLLACGIHSKTHGHPHHGEEETWLHDPFHQLEETWPTPDEVRLASGAPGPDYWQQQVDYMIDVVLDDEQRELQGKAQITYHNRSPHTLEYLWVQMDQNRFKETSASHLTRTFKGKDRLYYSAIKGPRAVKARQPGFILGSVSDAQGKALKHRIVDTMMRIDLPTPLVPGEQVEFSISWRYSILRHRDVWARSGYEDLESLSVLDEKRRKAFSKLAPREGDHWPIGGISEEATAGPAREASNEADQVHRRIYEIAQWYPRLAAYTDVTGWHNKGFLGSGEFTLEFGDFLVRITAPDTFTVAATGELINPAEVLSLIQRERLTKAQSATTPQWIITPEEARAQSTLPAKTKKTWVFSATNVRDFAFAASNSYLWDAMGYRSVQGDQITAMSFYPPEASALWHRYSTQAVAHTLEVYERHAFPYPYPVAISVNGPVFGMEYPMISFNGVRPEVDDTYSSQAKYALISVIIHEVGHFFFPMIVNSDERQWTWLDEGINSFLQYQAERAWEKDYPSRIRLLSQIVDYMTSEKQRPIMTNSESILQFGQNAYRKPAAALSILRETVIGPDLFDEAFKAYAKRWKFKRPMPADFFRTMEDVSGIDLDWFWRGWFYSTAHVDVRLASVKRLYLKSGDPDRDKPILQRKHEMESQTIVAFRDEGRSFRIHRYPELADFYTDFDPYDVTPMDTEEALQFREKLQKEHPERAEELALDGYFYVVTIQNNGGLVTPLPLKLTFEDGRTKMRRIPAEVWRKDSREIDIFLDLKSPLRSIEFDPYQETADVDRSDNLFPQQIIDDGFFELQVWDRGIGPNPMQRVRIYEKKQSQEVDQIKQSKEGE